MHKTQQHVRQESQLAKAGLELKAAAHRMAGLTADITHEEEEES